MVNYMQFGPINSVLSEDSIQQIFTWLPRESKALAGAVCKGWYHLINSQPQNLWRLEASCRFQANQFIFPKIDFALENTGCSTANNSTESKSLGEIVTLVHKAACTHNIFPQETMGQIADGLIAIMLGGKYEQASWAFPKLEPVTTDLAVAGPKYLMLELSNPQSPIRVFAVDAFRKIAAFYIKQLDEKQTLPAGCFNTLNGMVQAFFGACQYKNEVVQIISIFQCRLPLIQEFTCRMCPSQNKEMLFNEIATLVQKAPSPITWKTCVISNDHRLYFKMMLEENMVNLLTLSRDEANFEQNIISILDLSCDSIKGLSMCSAEEFSELRTPGRGNQDPNRYFGHLTGYLTGQNYQYVLNNTTQPTSTLRKAAVFYIIQGLESDNVDVKNHALKLVKSLFEDYFADGKKGAANQHYLRVMFEVLRAYVDVEGEQDVMANTVSSFLRKHLVEFKQFILCVQDEDDKEVLNQVVLSLEPVVEEVVEGVTGNEGQ